MKYDLFVDKKCIVWKRRYITIEANNLKEAIEKSKNVDFEEGYTEELYETEEVMCPEENDGYPTIEVYEKDSDTPIWTNIEK